MTMLSPREKCCAVCLLVFGVLLLVIGIVIIAVMPTLTKIAVDKQVALTEGGYIERLWQDPPFKISMQFWLFNVTNPLEVIHEGAKPALVQKGPYGYRETQQKKQVVYAEENTKISYVNQKIYFFDPSLSCPTCREDDVYTIPNVPYLTAQSVITEMVNGAGGLGSLLMMGSKAALLAMGEQLFVEGITAKEFLFDGYDDKILSLLDKIQPGRALKKMGLFFGRNNTDDGVYVIGSGKGNLSDIGRIFTWKGQTNLSFTGWWNSTEAERISGSDGTLYPPFIKRSDRLYAFMSDICRSIYLKYYSDIDFQGIKAYRFRLDTDCFDPYLPENQGFCWPMKDTIYSEDIQPKQGDGWCLPTGMNDISRCQFDSPIVTSFPHFTYSPKEVRQSVNGLLPESDQYLSYLDVEPTSGAMLAGSRMIQLNVVVQPDPDDLLTKNMKSVIVPLAWVNESVTIDPPTRDYIYQNVVVMRESAYVVGYGALGFGLLWTVTVAVTLVIYSANHPRRHFLRLK